MFCLLVNTEEYICVGIPITKTKWVRNEDGWRRTISESLPIGSLLFEGVI
jgi:hypothetical protein